LRWFDLPHAEAIPGTENATAPFFSPDGQWIGFFTESEIKKVALTGGAPFTVCAVTNGLDGAWTEDDTIVFGIVGPTDLFQVSAQGGIPEALTTRDDSSLIEIKAIPGHRKEHHITPGEKIWEVVITRRIVARGQCLRNAALR
jgi:hypothetical protein